jgi:hypothetical protein
VKPIAQVGGRADTDGRVTEMRHRRREGVDGVRRLILRIGVRRIAITPWIAVERIVDESNSHQLVVRGWACAICPQQTILDVVRRASSRHPCLAMTQKALIVRTGPDGHDGLEALNIALERGWRVAKVAPMGGAAGPADTPCHAALVILERADQHQPTLAVEALERIERGGGSIREDVLNDPDEVVEDNGTEPLDAPRP